MFAELASTLQRKLKVPKELRNAGRKHRVDWTEEIKEAFEKLKADLMEGLHLHPVDPTRPFVLRTDAADYAIGAVLSSFWEPEACPGWKI